MKSNSDKRPAVFHDLGDGSWHYNYNIEEVREENFPQEDEEQTVFNYDTVHFWGNPEYEKLVALIIRENYTIDAEFSILRQKESKPQKFVAYNTFCEGVKEMVQRDLLLSN